MFGDLDGSSGDVQPLGSLIIQQICGLIEILTLSVSAPQHLGQLRRNHRPLAFS
ncbi:hypothetical protein SAMN02927900_04232 [Rhizobium mongolense subsp. loessense]|uniref:Uncharacterized protein n=1 Tax=Rhizobium mongolense subsp. loessense TaxID=158890 RepID=A0A1G4SWM1_9HYPH|nr:hypothetical protein SAMN02927900_04232 [Rhizobium mongolense subsp. loessense]